MYEQFKEKLEQILDFYSIVNDREAIMKDLSEVVNNEKLEQKLEQILDFYSIDLDREDITKDIADLVRMTR